MILRCVRAALVLLGIAAVLAGIVGMRPEERSKPQAPLPNAGVGAATLVQWPHPTGLLGLSAVTTPFRVTRKAARVRWDEPVTVLQTAPPATPKPALSLTGVLWGDAPAAIIEGVPGHDGPLVLYRGESDGPLQIRQIDSLTVTVAGLDTVWVLRVREPWK